jgi:hypothetical protein
MQEDSDNISIMTADPFHLFPLIGTVLARLHSIDNIILSEIIIKDLQIMISEKPQQNSWEPFHGRL